ncbi:MAG: hypothetical protein ONB16_11885 [candidate division KSB1 bacterium]|nr:hypothetical protein [candidate division KSB1 bacterium]
MKPIVHLSIIGWLWLSSSLVLMRCAQSPTAPDLVPSKELTQIPFGQLSGKIAFRRALKDQPQQYYFMLLDGEQRSMKDIAFTELLVPTNLLLSPDGTRIIFANFVFKLQINRYVWQMYVMDIPTLSIRNVAPSEDDDSFGAWAPDGQRIAFWSNRNQTSSLWLVDLELDSAYFLVEVDEVTRTRPAWFSDNRRLVFASTDSMFHPTFYEFDLSELSPKQIYTDERSSADVIFKHPAISHDDRWLVFVKSYRSTFDEIWLFCFETRTARRLTTGAWDWHPAWSPDDRHILFSRGTHLFIVTTAGDSLRQVTFSKHTDEYPSWAP